eukprot:jgi/Chrzof1/5154/Cz15g13160.t1
MDISILLDRLCYFPGEVVKCLVKIRHNCPDASLAAIVSNLELTAQCTGTERVDPSWIANLYRPDTQPSKDNKRLVRSIFTSATAHLYSGAADQAPGFQSAFSIRFKLPCRIPPTYKGSAIRFQYQVQVQGSCRYPGKSGTTFHCNQHVPFLVWPLADRQLERRPSLPISGSPHAASIQEQQLELDPIEYRLGVTDTKVKWEEVALSTDGTPLLPRPSNPLSPTASLITQPSLLSAELINCEPDQLTEAADSADNNAAESATEQEDAENPTAGLRALTPLQKASMQVRTYNLRAGDFPLVRVTAHPPLESLLQPGGTVGVLLDFRVAHGPESDPDQQPRCLQLVALLEAEEIVHAPYTHGKTGTDSTSMRKLYSEQQELTAHLLTSQFLFSIPPNAPPSFRTSMVSHRWVLRFELTLGVPKKGVKQTTEQIVWMLPLIVFPPPMYS